VCVIVIAIWYFSAATPAPGGNNVGNGQIPPGMPPQVQEGPIAPQVPINPEAPVSTLSRNLTESFNRRPQTGWDLLGVSRPSTDVSGASGSTLKISAVAPKTIPTRTPDVGFRSIATSSEQGSHNATTVCEVIDVVTEVEGRPFSDRIHYLLDLVTNNVLQSGIPVEEWSCERVATFDQVIESAKTFSAQLVNIVDFSEYLHGLDELIDENVIVTAIISIADWLETIVVNSPEMESVTSKVFSENYAMPALGLYITAIFVVIKGRAFFVRFIPKIFGPSLRALPFLILAIRSSINLVLIRLISIKQRLVTRVQTLQLEFLESYKNIPKPYFDLIWVCRFRTLVYKFLYDRNVPLELIIELKILIALAKYLTNKCIGPSAEIIKELKIYIQVIEEELAKELAKNLAQDLAKK
jgi:hypothetical protein